jgi:hypothetical protein
MSNKPKILICEENRRKFTLNYPRNWTKTEKIKIDDGLIKVENIKKCDYVVIVIDNKDIKLHIYYIELKGKDVEHAIKQLKSTLEYVNTNKQNLHLERLRGYSKIEALAICSKIEPYTDSSIQVSQVKFKKNYNCFLSCKCNQWTTSITEQ